MIADKIVIPKFASEAEEADWLDEHREEHDEIMAKAMQEGHTTAAPQFWEQRGIKPDTIRVHLKAADVNLARVQAQARGIDTESYLQSLVHDAVIAAR